MKTRFLFLILLILISGTFTKCQKNRYSAEEQAIVDEIMKYRAEKDSTFLHADWTPLLKEDQPHFKGLSYFPIDLSLHFKGPVVRYDTVILDTIMGTKGDLRPAVKYGYFPFVYRSKNYRLQIYQILPQDSTEPRYLFLGFTDLSTSKETYGTGRYIDLEGENNQYVVDFNLAYNPYCAYNPRYTCAIPPEENKLPFKILAGEKIFKKH